MNLKSINTRSQTTTTFKLDVLVAEKTPGPYLVQSSLCSCHHPDSSNEHGPARFNGVACDSVSYMAVSIKTLINDTIILNKVLLAKSAVQKPFMYHADPIIIQKVDGTGQHSTN